MKVSLRRYENASHNAGGFLSDAEIASRFAYMALYKAHLEGDAWLPNIHYALHDLLARGHVDVNGAFVRLNSSGVMWWLLVAIVSDSNASRRKFAYRK